MRTTWLIGLVALIAVSLCSCNKDTKPTQVDDDGDDLVQMQLTLSGAVSQSFAGTVLTRLYSPDVDHWVFGAVAVATLEPPLAAGIGLTIEGGVHVGTFSSSAQGVTGEVYIGGGTGDPHWRARTGGESEPAGSFTLQITSTGDPVEFFGALDYPDLHGTLDAVLPADPESGASGTVTLHATF